MSERTRQRFPFPTQNGLGFVRVPDPFPEACAIAVMTQVRSLFFPADDAEDEDDALRPRRIRPGAILGRSPSSAIPPLAPGISRCQQLRVMRIKSTPTGPRVSVRALVNANPNPNFATNVDVYVYKNQVYVYKNQAMECHYFPQGEDESLRMGDAITFVSRDAANGNISPHHYCLVFWAVPAFDVKRFVECDLKMLPHVVHWCDETKQIQPNGADEGPRQGASAASPDFDSLKLSAIYEFARGAPLSFVPAPAGKRKG